MKKTMKKENAVLILKSFEVSAYNKDIKLTVSEERPGYWMVKLGNICSGYIPTAAIPYVMNFARLIGETLTNGQMYGYKLDEKKKEENKFYIDGLKKELDEAGFGY